LFFRQQNFISNTELNAGNIIGIKIQMTFY